MYQIQYLLPSNKERSCLIPGGFAKMELKKREIWEESNVKYNSEISFYALIKENMSMGEKMKYVDGKRPGINVHVYNEAGEELIYIQNLWC